MTMRTVDDWHTTAAAHLGVPRTVVASLTLVTLLATACSSGAAAVRAAGTASAVPAASDPSASVAATTGTRSAGATCTPAAADVVTDIGGGLKRPATAITNAVSVATSNVERHSLEQPTLIVAARIAGARNVIGTWAYGNGSITALNAAARRYSEWGSAAAPGSPADVARTKMLQYPETTKAQQCAGHPVAGAASASIGANRCGFPSAPDVIYWFKTQGQPATSERLGAYDYGNCTRTADQTQLEKTSPQGPGDCTIVASLAANPGYDFDATPAPRPRGEMAETGAGC